MNPRIAKEFRALSLPWIVCAVASFGHFAGKGPGSWAQISGALAAFAFFAGCLILAALPFGTEFQQRTWTLVLGQPVDRFRLWKEKFLTATAAVLTLVAVHSTVALLAKHRLPFDDLLPVLGFVVATICCAGLCALTSRSVIGGMAFAICYQFLAMGLVSAGIYFGCKIAGHDAATVFSWPFTIIYIAVGVSFSAFTLWLGWRVFARMELRDATASANLTLPDWLIPKSVAVQLRCQPTGAWRNLIRKEFCLQKPVFTIAAIFMALWIIGGFLFLLTQSTTYKVMLDVLTVLHIPIVSLLVGCVADGDEKSLDTRAWHLTLPIAAYGQWMAKFLVATIVAVSIGAMLPIATKSVAEPHGFGTEETVMACFIAWTFMTLGFWSASLTRNTVSAVITTIATIVGLSAVIAMATALARVCGGLLSWPLSWYLAHFQSSIHPPPSPGMALLVISTSACVALTAVQSARLFRRIQPEDRSLIGNVIALAGLVFLLTFGWVDFDISRFSGYERVWGPASNSMRAASRSRALESPAPPLVLTSAELEKTGLLTPLAKRWLRGSTIEVQRRPLNNARLEYYSANVRFPNGKVVPLSWSSDRTPLRAPEE